MKDLQNKGRGQILQEKKENLYITLYGGEKEREGDKLLVILVLHYLLCSMKQRKGEGRRLTSCYSSTPLLAL